MRGLSSYEIRQLILSVGTRKSTRPLSPVEVAKLMQKALDAGEKRADIADRLYLDNSTMIGHFTRLLSLPTQVQQLIGWGADPVTVSFTAAYEIARLDSTQEQSVLTKASLESQLDKFEMRQVVQIRRRSRNPIEDCIKAVLNQRPIVEKRHLIIGELGSEKLKKELKQISQLERNNLLQSTLERYVPDIPYLGCKLGDVYFLLVGDARFHTAIMSLLGGFEKSITEYLIQELGNKD